MLHKNTHYPHAHTNAHQMLDALRELTRVIAAVHISIEENGKVFILSFSCPPQRPFILAVYLLCRIPLSSPLYPAIPSPPQSRVTGAVSQVIVAGTSQLHLEGALQHLRSEILGPKENVKMSNLAVSYMETVTVAMKHACVSISPNKANRLSFKATPISEDVSKKIESFEITFRESPMNGYLISIFIFQLYSDERSSYSRNTQVITE